MNDFNLIWALSKLPRTVPTVSSNACIGIRIGIFGKSEPVIGWVGSILHVNEIRIGWSSKNSAYNALVWITDDGMKSELVDEEIMKIEYLWNNEYFCKTLSESCSCEENEWIWISWRSDKISRTKLESKEICISLWLMNMIDDILEWEY